MRRSTAIGLLAGAGLAATSRTPVVEDFNWKTIEPSSSLNYTTCYSDFKCAKLLVPLDWLDESNEARVTLAIIARPAVVKESDSAFGGSIIVNPGGPSGSGVDFVLRAGEVIQNTADGENKKYEILSFDPRGVGLTEPRADCIQDEFARGEANVEDRAVGSLADGISVLRRRLARYQAYGQICQPDADDKNDIKGFVSTSSVARDIVAITDKLAELRKEAAGSEDEQRLELRSESKNGDDTPRFLYWGFSYGTLLGRYLVSMFPGRVGRVILEAVADVHDYARGEWATNLPDTQASLQHFWDTCFDGGKNCALYKDSDKNAGDIEDRVRAWIDELDEKPAPYLSGHSYLSITKDDVLNAIFVPLYQPQRAFVQLAQTLSEAMSGNFTTLYEGIGRPEIAESCPVGNPDDAFKYTWALDAQASISCGDGDSQVGLSTKLAQEHVKNLTDASPDFGALWSRIRLVCTGWRFRPKYDFKGPFVTPEPDLALKEGIPGAGILIVSSQYDPVTPLVNARMAAAEHPGAAVLMQKNVGHGSLLSPGKCRENFIKKYFETGELPDKETVCEPDCKPFQKCEASKAFGALDASDTRTRERASSRRAPLELF